MPPQLVKIASSPHRVGQVYRGPLDAISKGSLAPGTPITQDDIAEKLAISRQPVRMIGNKRIRDSLQHAGFRDCDIVSLKVPDRSVIPFHACPVDASGSHLSPLTRVSIYSSVRPISDHSCRRKRPDYRAHPDFTPITTMSDDRLFIDYPSELHWKDREPACATQTSSA